VLLDAWIFTAKGVLEQRNMEPDNEEFYENLLTQVIRWVTHDMGNRGGFEELGVEVTINGYDAAIPIDPTDRKDLGEYSEERLRTFLHQGDITSEQFARAILEKDDDDTDEE